MYVEPEYEWLCRFIFISSIYVAYIPCFKGINLKYFVAYDGCYSSMTILFSISLLDCDYTFIHVMRMYVFLQEYRFDDFIIFRKYLDADKFSFNSRKVSSKTIITIE